jgi:hypothetical protein
VADGAGKQVMLVDGGDSAAPPRAVTPWAPNVQYTLEHHGGWLYALVDAAYASEHTNRLLRTPAEACTLPPMSSWQVSVRRALESNGIGARKLVWVRRWHHASFLFPTVSRPPTA